MLTLILAHTHGGIDELSLFTTKRSKHWARQSDFFYKEGILIKDDDVANPGLLEYLGHLQNLARKKSDCDGEYTESITRYLQEYIFKGERIRKSASNLLRNMQKFLIQYEESLSSKFALVSYPGGMAPHGPLTTTHVVPPNGSFKPGSLSASAPLLDNELETGSFEISWVKVSTRSSIGKVSEHAQSLLSTGTQNLNSATNYPPEEILPVSTKEPGESHVNTTSSHTRTPTSPPPQPLYCEAIREGDLTTLNFLSEAAKRDKELPNRKCRCCNQSLLHIAIDCQQTGCLKSLLQIKAIDIHLPLWTGGPTPVELCITEQYEAGVEALIDSGAIIPDKIMKKIKSGDIKKTVKKALKRRSASNASIR